MPNQTEDILQRLAERHFSELQDELFRDVKASYLRCNDRPEQPLSLVRLQERAVALQPDTSLLPDAILLPEEEQDDLASENGILVDYKSSRAHNSHRNSLAKQFTEYCEVFQRKLFIIASWHYGDTDFDSICKRAGLRRGEDVFFFYVPVQKLIAASVERDGDRFFIVNENGDYVHRVTGLTYSSQFELPEPVTEAGNPWPRSGKRNTAFRIVAHNPGLTREELEEIARAEGVDADFGLVLTNSSERIRFEEAGLAESPARYTLEWPRKA